MRQHFQLVEKALGRLDVHQAGDALGDVVDFVDAKRQGHAAFAAELVDEDFVAGMAFDVFKQQRRTAGGVVPFAMPGLDELDPDPILLIRSVISVISSSGETSSRMRLSSPCFSRVLIQSRRSSYAKGILRAVFTAPPLILRLLSGAILHWIQDM